MDREPELLQKLPPQSLDLEQGVLGAILLENEALVRVLEVLNDHDFYQEAHRWIFQAMIELFEENVPIDLLTVNERLRKKEQLEAVGGASYLTELVDRVPTAANVWHHARIVRDKAVLRGLIQTATGIVTAGYNDSEDVDTLLDRAEQAIFEISQRKSTTGFVNLNTVLKGSFRHIEQLYKRKEFITGVPTGFLHFDRLTAGLQPADLIIIAGRPSMGKTAFCLNIAQHVGVRAGRPVAIFSLEMSKEQLVLRMLCSEARVDASKLRTGFLSREDWPRLTKAAGTLSETQIHIDDTPAQSSLDIRAKTRRLRAEQGDLALVIVDYLQLMRGRAWTENRQQEIAEITRALKALAKELQVPVLALSQLSRAVEYRKPPRPQLSDLRESGAIEQDADVVALIYRDEVYNGEDSSERGIAEIILGKQRNGPTGLVKLHFYGEHTRFDNLEEREF
ncbi:Replicative DNA helicase [Candidatus Entotheonellaceae bacterium PAL068K]